jgi:hypothetical protein
MFHVYLNPIGQSFTLFFVFFLWTYLIQPLHWTNVTNFNINKHMAKTFQPLDFLLTFSLLGPSIDGLIYGCMDVKQFVIPTTYYFLKWPTRLA